MSHAVADVAMPLPLQRLFSYRLPEDIAEAVRPGARVRVPFGPRQLTGVVMAVRRQEDADGLKDVERLLDREPLVSPALLTLAERMSRHYFCGVGEALGAFLPAGVKKGARGKRTAVVSAVLPQAREALADWPAKTRSAKQREVLEAVLAAAGAIPRQTLMRMTRCSASPIQTLQKRGLLRVEFEEQRDDVFARLDIRPTAAPALNADQTGAVGALHQALDRGEARGFLLEGVTGSGKTEVYLAAIEKTLSLGRSAIILVPEISLTPQTVERFESRFGSAAVLHSHLTDAERAHQWEELRDGRRLIAIGPRSAVFAPVRRLGLIILDEEHESTFKQQNVPRYHARDVALMRGRAESAVVVLGSATPSLETYDAAQRNELGWLRLPRRIGDAPMPAVSLVDMRSQRPVGPAGLFSPILANLVDRTLERGEQVLLFLNRRGYNTSLMCRRCGYVKPCKNCDIPMTYYRSTHLLLCHYCHHQISPPRACPECRHADIFFKGFGTEMVEHAARVLFPRARIARMDGESMRKRFAHEEMFRSLKAGEVDILIGTQMVAKGLDFPSITLIGVVAGDTSLLIPDFRAAERTFQLMTQVSGRAGRGALPGRVIIQTYNPEHYSHRAAASHDFAAFADEELAFRREAHYPPYGVLVRIVIQGADEAKVDARAERIGERLAGAAEAAAITMLGPGLAPIPFLKKLHRRHIILRAFDGETLMTLLRDKHVDLRGDRRIQVLVDRDPTSMM